VPYRGSHRRRSKVTLVAPPIVMAAAASISVSASAVQPAHPAAAVADVSELGPAVPLEPFAAMPAVVPFPSRTVTITRHSPPASAPIAHLPTDLSGAAAAIPRRALAAYVNAARIVDTMQPECELSWQTLAGIGLIESDHARSGGSASPHWNGVATPPIYGPPLDGSGKDARIPNNDPAVDGAGRWARAVGPMQWPISAVTVAGGIASDTRSRTLFEPNHADTLTASSRAPPGACSILVPPASGSLIVSVTTADPLASAVGATMGGCPIGAVARGWDAVNGCGADGHAGITPASSLGMLKSDITSPALRRLLGGPGSRQLPDRRGISV
jgi:hypothetical protein